MSKVVSGINDLATIKPELAKEWHPTKNKNLKPTEVAVQSGKKVWWWCEKGHEWEAVVSNRTKGSGCPICAKEKRSSFPEQAAYYYIKKFFPDAINGDRSVLNRKEIDVYIPSLKTGIEYDGKFFHQDVQKDLEKDFLAAQKGIKLIRIREIGCPKLESNFSKSIFRESSSSSDSLDRCLTELLLSLNISLPQICVNTERDFHEILEQIYISKKEKSLQDAFPEVAKKWHPTKNGKLTPDMFSAFSNKKVWWYLPYDDPKTGEHFDFEWQNSISHMAKYDRCPYLIGKAVWKGFNDLATKHPEIAKQWHPTKNGKLTPEMVTHGSERKVWWYLPYDDPKTGKHFDFEWKATITNRVAGQECPYLSGKAVWVGFNDLETTYPEVAKQWHPTKNGNLTPRDITAGSGKKVWWLLPYDDPVTKKHFDFEWEAEIVNRASVGRGCPYLVGKAVWVGFNDLATIYPELVSEWHPTKNGALTPYNITSRSNKKVWWIDKNGREWEETVERRTAKQKRLGKLSRDVFISSFINFFIVNFGDACIKMFNVWVHN